MTNTRVILVRHGETTANHEQRWYGAMDAPLTDRGRLQVQATGRSAQGGGVYLKEQMFFFSP